MYDRSRFDPNFFFSNADNVIRIRHNSDKLETLGYMHLSQSLTFLLQNKIFYDATVASWSLVSRMVTTSSILEMNGFSSSLQCVVY